MSTTVTSHLRPGVYSVYEASAVVGRSPRRGWAGVVGLSEGGTPGKVYPLGTQAEAAQAFGKEDNLTQLVQVCMANGAARVLAVPVEDSSGYAAAFALLAPGETAQDGGARVAAALAGAICGEADPARPFGGAALQGIGSLATRYSESEVDTLLQGGVTPVELVGGVCSVIRGVTTRTKTGEAADATWRELTTILVVDDVIPSIRAALGAKFARAKNTAQTRGAVRSQVILELEGKVAAEIISGYGEVTAQALESDPTVCLVTFSFTVAQGLNQIWLSAQITV